MHGTMNIKFISVFPIHLRQRLTYYIWYSGSLAKVWDEFLVRAIFPINFTPLDVNVPQPHGADSLWLGLWNQDIIATENTTALIITKHHPSSFYFVSSFQILSTSPPQTLCLSVRDTTNSTITNEIIHNLVSWVITLYGTAVGYQLCAVNTLRTGDADLRF